jgi:hypothetical protein
MANLTLLSKKKIDCYERCGLSERLIFILLDTLENSQYQYVYILKLKKLIFIT